MADIAIGPTANRRVLRCLNEAAFAVSEEFGYMHERYLADHENYLSRLIHSTTGYRPPLNWRANCSRRLARVHERTMREFTDGP